MDNTKQVLNELDEIIAEFTELDQTTKRRAFSIPPLADLMKFVGRALAAIHRVAGRQSVYLEQYEKEIDPVEGSTEDKARCAAGILRALRADVAGGYLKTQRQLLHAEVFADFLEMAQHLVDEGYKDAAAVIAGGSLEEQLRQLCEKSQITCDTVSNGKTVPKKADRLNSELAAANAYSKLDQKAVTAWLDLRNKAAHGHYGEYTADQVNLQISGIRDFITRNPA